MRITGNKWNHACTNSIANWQKGIKEQYIYKGGQRSNKLQQGAEILGTHSPLSVLQSIFYVFGIHACLRGGEEHRKLRFSMIQRSSLDWVYTGKDWPLFARGFENI